MAIFKFKNVLHFICIVFYCSVLTSGEKKEIPGLLPLPPELQEKIILQLPETEINKLSLINKQTYNETYFIRENHRHRAFQNYLLYPFLSSFYEEPVFEGRREDIQYRGTEERDTLSILLKNDDDKSFFYSLLLQDAHRDYFKSKNWIKFFNLRTKSYFEGRVTRIMPHTKDRTLHKQINKVFIVHIKGTELLGNAFNDIVNGCAEAIYDNMHRGKTKTEDQVRIVIDDMDISPTDIFHNQNILAVKFKFYNLLISNIAKRDENNKTSKITLIKTLDLTTYNIPTLWTDPVIDTDTIIKGIPKSVQLQVNYSQALFSKKMKGKIQNIIFRPSFSIPMVYQVGNQLIADNNLFDIDNIELLCKSGFALSLISNIGQYLLTIEDRFQEDQQIIRMLSQYISPFTRNIDGLTFLDYLFYAPLTFIPEEQARKIIEFSFSIAKEVGIDPNRYIVVKHAAIPLQIALEALNTVTKDTWRADTQKVAIFVLQLAQKGVDLSLEFNRNVMKTFFEQMHLFEPDTQKNIFDSIVDNEIVSEDGKNIYQRKTQEGNTLLHLYFKYSMVFNRDIVFKILNQLPEDMINVKNNKGESIFECCIWFIQKHLNEIHLGDLTIDNPLQIDVIISFVESLLGKKFDLTQLTSTEQTYVDFINDLIREDMEMGHNLIINFEKRKKVDFLQKILGIIKPLQGRIVEKRQSRW